MLLAREDIDPDIQENVRLRTTSIKFIIVYVPPSQITGWSALRERAIT